MPDIFLIQKPHITEKSTDLQKIGKYVFMVESSATKNEIKKAIKQIYNVDAVKINIVNLPEKIRKFRGLKSKTAKRKKAVVVLKSGQKIEI